MGVNLTPIVARREISLQDLRGRTIAVDGNLELYQFLSIMRTRDGSPLRDSQGRVTSHLNGLAFRTTRLVADYGIQPIFVFDGPPPKLKQPEIERRRDVRERAGREYEAALRAGDIGKAWSKAVAATRLTHAMVEEAKTLLGLLGIPVLQAPSEGEAQAAALAREGVAWAVGSKDYDSLLFGAPRLTRFVAVASREFLPSRGISRRVSPELIELDPWLRDLGLSRPQLVDVAVLVGTDFDEGVHGVGPKTALKLVLAHGSIESLPPEIRSALPEDVDSIRRFFLDPPVVSSDRVARGSFRPESVIRFLCDERDFSRARVERIIERLRGRVAGRIRLDDFTDDSTSVTGIVK